MTLQCDSIAAMQVHVLHDADAVAERAAEIIASEARSAVSARGRFTLALSGGKTPARMLRALAVKEVPWKDVFIFQVDERVAPAESSDRNLALLGESLQQASLPLAQLHPMLVDLPDLQAGAEMYASTLRGIAGDPPVLDLVHLGLGTDGHTASLVPGDPVLNVRDRDVALSGSYQGRRRMTLTYPIIDRARRLLWVVTGSEKAEMLARLRISDPTIPAGLVRQDHAVVLADRAAGGVR